MHALSWFGFGLLVGVLVGWVLCAVFSFVGSDDEEDTPRRVEPIPAVPSSRVDVVLCGARVIGRQQFCRLPVGHSGVHSTGVDES